MQPTPKIPFYRTDKFYVYLGPLLAIVIFAISTGLGVRCLIVYSLIFGSPVWGILAVILILLNSGFARFLQYLGRKRGTPIKGAKLFFSLPWLVLGLSGFAWNFYQSLPSERFKTFVINPIPASIKNISVDAIKGFSSERTEICFDTSLQDLETIIRTRKFIQVTDPESKLSDEDIEMYRKDNVSEKQIAELQLPGKCSYMKPYLLKYDNFRNPDFYVIEVDPYVTICLITNKSHNRAFVIEHQSDEPRR